MVATPFRTSASEHDHSQPERALTVVREERQATCVRCRWHKSFTDWIEMRHVHRCTAPRGNPKRCHVTGKMVQEYRYQECGKRNTDGWCGDFVELDGIGVLHRLWRWLTRRNR